MRSGGALQFLVVKPAMPHNSGHPSLVAEWNSSYSPYSHQPSQNIIFLSLLQDASSVPLSSSNSRERSQERLGSIPKNLDADANEEKGREPQDDTHSTLADHGSQTVGETVTEVDAEGHERGADNGGKNGEEVRAQVVRLVCSESDGDGNRTRTDGERQSQRIKSIAKNILQVDLFLDLTVAVMVFLALEHGPPVGNDNEAASDLDDRNGDSKEIQDVRSDQKGSNQKDEAVHGHAAGENSARGGGIFVRQGEKDRAAAERIHDGKQCAENQQDTFGDFQQGGSSGRESIAEARLCRFPVD